MLKKLLILILITLSSSLVSAELTLTSGKFTPITSKTTGSLQTTGIKLNEFVEANATGSLTFSLDNFDKIQINQNIAKGIVGAVYNYPNPVKQNGTTTVGYELTTQMDIEIVIYDSRGNQVFQKFIPAGTEGSLGPGHYNKVDLRANGLNISSLPVGIYFYLVKSGNDILGKSKMAIVP